MVDIVARVVADGDSRNLEFKSDDVTFGGGRLTLPKTNIPLDWDELMKIYENQEGTEVVPNENVSNTNTNIENTTNENTNVENTEIIEPSKRQRKSRAVEELTTDDTEEKPRRRRARSEA